MTRRRGLGYRPEGSGRDPRYEPPSENPLAVCNRFVAFCMKETPS